MKSRRALGIALVACTADRPADVRRRVLSQFHDDELAQLAQHAWRHRVVPFLAAAVRTAELHVSDDAAAALARTHATRTAAHLRVLADLDNVRAGTRGPGRPVPGGKGPDPVRTPLPVGRSAHVRGSRSASSPWIVRASGGRAPRVRLAPLRSELDAHARGYSGSAPLPTADGDARRRPLASAEQEDVREGFAIDTDDLFERSREVEVGGGWVPTSTPSTCWSMWLCTPPSPERTV